MSFKEKSPEEKLKLAGFPVDRRHLDFLRSAIFQIEWRGEEYSLESVRSKILQSIHNEPVVNEALEKAKSEVRKTESGSIKNKRLSETIEEKLDTKIWSSAELGPLLNAPYRFAVLNESVVAAQSQPDLDRPLPGGLCATLKVSWRIETPLLVGAGDSNDVPFALGGPKDWVIPGATLRGVVRAALEAVAHARLVQTNRRYRFALRDFEHPRYKRFIKEGGVGDGALKAGWLTKECDKYKIRPCKTWGRIPIDLLKARIRPEEQKKSISWAKFDRTRKYTASSPDLKLVFEPHWKDRKLAFKTPRAFRSERDRHQQEVFRPLPIGESGTQGFYVFSGAATDPQKKQYEYVFFDDPEAKSVALTERSWLNFLVTNTKQGNRDREPDGAWKEFGGDVVEGQRIPIFFYGDLNEQNEEFCFGLTRLFRMPHAHAVGDLVPKPHELRLDDRGRLEPDLVEALFGYVFETEDFPQPRPDEAVAHKGRIAFGFARPVNRKAFELWPGDKKDPLETIQGAPKPSFAPFYLVGPEKDWSADNAQLAGRKRYVPREAEDSGLMVERLMEHRMDDARAGGAISKKTISKLRFLRPISADATFSGEIRLHNVSEAELGAILWVLTFGGGGANRYRHMLGRGKPFGAGRAAVAGIEGSIRRNADPEKPEKITWKIGDGAGELGPFLEKFEAQMDSALGRPGAWRASGPVRSFLACSLPQDWRLPEFDYLNFARDPKVGEKNNGWRFKKLRDHTGLGAQGAPDRLLKAPPDKDV